jgi:hypothetical protein
MPDIVRVNAVHIARLRFLFPVMGPLHALVVILVSTIIPMGI